jgi:response regulator of citrate/malate metabolism
MNANAVQRLDEKIAELTRRIERLKALRTAIGDDTIADDIAELFDRSLSCGNGAGRKRRTSPTANAAMMKIRSAFEANHNQQMTLKELAAKTGISWHTIRQFAYMTYRDQFEREGHRGGGQESKFRLKNLEHAESGN